MKELYAEGLATRSGPKSCGAVRKGGIEALRVVRAGRVFSRERSKVRDADAVGVAQDSTAAHQYREMRPGPSRSQTPCTYGNTSHKTQSPLEKAVMTGKATAKDVLRILLLTTLALLVAKLPASAEISQRDQKAIADAGTCDSPQSVLQSCGLIYIATVRKNHTQSTAAPVWFTTGADNNAFLIQTGKDTWKAKRIRRGSPVLVWIGKANGPAFIGTAEITSDPAIQNKILTDFRQKYWRNRVLGTGPSRAAFQSGERVAIKIKPLRDLPAGFTAAPGTPPPPLHSGS